jgi:hypothetical protein
MSHEVSGNLRDDGILDIAIRGDHDPGLILDMILEVVKLARQPGVKCLLIDIRELRGRASFSESYFNIRSIPADSPRLKTAVLELPEHIEKGVFFDTAAGNMGFTVKHFIHEGDALSWLAQGTANADETPRADTHATTIR